jgi:cytochrome c biogenesis factor
MHDVHSSDHTVITLSTFIDEGHAFAQSPQSMQLVAFLFILFGLIKFNIPSSAP